jgi:hypothetical protein
MPTGPIDPQAGHVILISTPVSLYRGVHCGGQLRLDRDDRRPRDSAERSG